jgi:hypothetical protein
MAIYVDNAKIEWRGKLWCHLVADTLGELHAFANRLGLQREWFQSHASYPHYDITTIARERALLLGAMIGDRRTVILCARKLKAELHDQNITDKVQMQLSLFQAS